MRLQGLSSLRRPVHRRIATRSDCRASRKYVRLYQYVALEQKELPQMCRRLLRNSKALGGRERVYLSADGINGQMTVPESIVSTLEQSFPRLFCNAKLVYGDLIENKTIDTKNANGTKPACEPFHKLDIRVRNQILHDGFERGDLNLQDAGHSLPPEQWHHKLKTRNESQESDILVLDVRNFYEHEIGRFDGATRIMVDTFRDTFDALDEILEKHENEHDGQKPKEVMMYCTGGIRCEKVGAYLTQYKGIPNVQKLHGGIVNYVRFLKEQRQAAKRARARSVKVGADTKSDDDDVEETISLFKGKNFVFDQRCVGNWTDSEEVTDDVLGQCFQCGEPCKHHTNCSNVMCGGMLFHYQQCARIHLGACSAACKQETITMKAMITQQRKDYRQQQAACWMPAIPNALSKYVSMRSRASLERRHFSASRFLYKCIDNSELQRAYVYNQSSSLTDDALLRELREATTRSWPKAEQLIDEMQGKFLSFLVQTTKAQRVLEIGCFTGYSALCIASGLAVDGSLVTCDIDSATMQFAQRFFKKSMHADQITGVNQDGLAYLTTAALSMGAQQEPFDMIFVDANKCTYRDYYDFIVDHHLLHSSGLLVFDNTLFRGRVAACATGSASSKERIAHSLAAFNKYVTQDARTTQVMVPLWDGLTLIQYNKDTTTN